MWKPALNKTGRALSRLGVWALAGLVLGTGPAIAHRGHSGVTDIRLDTINAEFEISHRVYGVDLMDALGESGRDASDVLASADGLDRIEAYVRAGFRFGEGDGALIESDFVGAEVDGEFVWIYFTAPVPADLSAFLVDNDLLADTVEDQEMLTNIRVGPEIRTARQGDGHRDPVRLVFN
ncbi:DUF6702 family protein [Maricaulis sp. CAU 1757]